MHKEEQSIHKEFELERLILFSDAVFAIAITLLIIEIKFPEVPKGTSGSNLFHLFQHTLVEFATFTLSFIIIGKYWLQHLKLCRYLKNYDDGLIVRNLFFLFFIVVFPFSAASMGHVTPSFLLPVYIYIINIVMLTIAHYVIAYYVLHQKKQLIISGEEVEKTYMLMSTKLQIYVLIGSITVVGLVYFIYPNNKNYQVISFQSITVFALISRYILKKYKPKKVA